MEKYQEKGTLQICPYSSELAIVSSSGSKVDKTKCEHFRECTIQYCPLEQELKHY